MPAQTLVLTKELVRALEVVLERKLAAPDAIVLLARYLDGLAKGYGLTEHSGDGLPDDKAAKVATWDPLHEVEKDLRLPKWAVEVVRHYLPESDAKNADDMRQRLYEVCERIDLDRIGTEHAEDVPTLAQMYWNLNGDKCKRPLLRRNLDTLKVDLVARKVAERGTDFSALGWTTRIRVMGIHRSSSGRLRGMGARLAVLAAIYIVKEKDGATADAGIPPTLGSATLEPDKSGKLQIRWAPAEEKNTARVLNQQRDATQAATTRQSMEEHSLVRPKLARPFSGREFELDELARFCTSIDEHRLLVVGERYSGKSALMAEFFVSDGTQNTLRLGYFVPTNQRQDARSEAMVKHLVRQAHLLATGEEIHLDSSNPGKLRELLDSCLDKTRRRGQNAVLVVDGIDEDLSSRDGMATMMSILDGLATPGLKLIVTTWSERIPDEAAQWRRLEIQRTQQVTENLQKMEAELETLFDQSSTRGVLQYLTFGSGTFQAMELAQLTGAESARRVRRTLAQSEERVFRAVRENGEPDLWGFAHPMYAEVSRALFEDSAGAWPAGELTSDAALAEADTQVRLESWAQSFRNAGWPADTPRYLLTDYPVSLADREDLAGLCRLIFDASYLRAVARRFGPANPIASVVARATKLALTARQDSDPVAGLETIAKLVTVGNNYKPISDTVPLALLEAVGRVSGPAAAKRLASHIIDHSIDYGPEDPLDRAEASPSLRTSEAQVVAALVRAGLGDMAKEYALKLDEPSVHEAYARALLLRGDRAGAVEAVHTWNSRIEEAVEGDWSGGAENLESLTRALLERLVKVSPGGRAEDAPTEGGHAETEDAHDDQPTSASILRQIMAGLATDAEGFAAKAPSLVVLRDGFRARATCVRLLREAGEPTAASELAARLREDYAKYGKSDASLALDVAAALVWSGDAPEARSLIGALPNRAVEVSNDQNLWMVLGGVR